MEQFDKPSHPIWGLGRLGILLTAMVVILYTNATSFDKTEVYTIIIVMIGAATAEGVSSAFGKPANHPVWGFARLALVMLVLTITLYLTASNFDKTELNVIIGGFLASAGVESLTGILGRPKPTA